MFPKLIYGCVTDKASGKPISGARVKLTTWHWWKDSERPPERVETETLADENGLYRAELKTLDLPGSSQSFMVEAEAAGYVPGIPPQPADKPDEALKEVEADVQLESAFALTGQVTDEEGNPIQDVEVIVYQSSSHGCFNPSLVGDWPKTNADGRFKADGMPMGLPSEQRQVAGFFHADYQRHFIHRIGDLPRDANRTAHVEVILQRGFSILGCVRDAAGNAVAGAKLLVMGERPYEGDPGCARPPARWEIKTDSDGRYVARGLPPLFYSVLAMHEAHPPGSALNVNLMHGSRENIDIVMSDTGVLAGKVTQADGSASADFEIKATQYMPHIEKTTRTDKDGRYRLSGLAPGFYVFFAGCSDMDSLAEFIPPDEKADVVLRGKVNVSGRLIDRDSGLPVTKTRVIRLAQNPVFGRGFCDELASDDGRFELKDVLVGKYFLCASSDGYTTTCRRIEITAESAELGDVQIHRGITLSGTVTTSEGMPIADAEVFIDSPEFYAGKTTRTDSAGRYKFPPLADAKYKMRVRAASWAAAFFDEVLLPADATNVTVDVRMTTGVTVRGRVADHGKPIRQQIVVLSRPVAENSWTQRRPWIQDTSTNLAGEFEFQHVEPGEYALRCGLEERRITVCSARDLRLDLDWPGKYEQQET